MFHQPSLGLNGYILTNIAVSIKSKYHSYVFQDNYKVVNTLKKTTTMKQEVLTDTADILHKIEAIEKGLFHSKFYNEVINNENNKI